MIAGAQNRAAPLSHCTVKVTAASDQDSSLWRCFRQVWQGRAPCGRPRTCWRDYSSQLAWKHLRMPLEELEDAAGAALLSLLPPQTQTSMSSQNWADTWILAKCHKCNGFLCVCACVLARCFVDKEVRIEDTIPLCNAAFYRQWNRSSSVKTN